METDHYSQEHRCVPDISPDLCRLVEAIAPHFRLGYDPFKHFVIAVELWRVREREEKDPFIGVIMPYDWPVYGSPFDRVDLVPVNIRNLDDADVKSWFIVAQLYLWSRPWRERALADAHETDINEAGYMNDLIGEVGDYIYHESMRPTAPRGIVTARKHMSARDRAILSGDYNPRYARTSDYAFPQHGAPLA